MSYYPQPDDGISKPPRETPTEIPKAVNPSPSETATKEQLQAAEAKIKDRMSSFEQATLRWTRAMFAATALTGIFIGFQWREMHEAAINDQRAWVGIGGIQLSELKPSEKITVQIPYTNTGKSLALDVRTRSFAYTGEEQFNPSDFISAHSNEPFQQPIVVFPGIPAASMSIVVPTADATAVVEAVKSGQKHFYVLGEIRYKDIFDRPHFTRFCGEYSIKTPGNLVSCKEYNTAD